MPKIKFQVTKRSPVDGQMHSIEFEAERKDFEAWERDGKLIQDAMPYLSVDEREFLITGIAPEQWDKLFGGKEM